MQRRMVLAMVFLTLLAVMGFSAVPFIGIEQAAACACAYNSGEPGGGDYVPQGQEKQGGSYFDRPALTRDQAHDLLARHLEGSNPDLQIGEIRDAGNFYEADILSAEKDVVEKLAVDKQTGRIRVIY